MIGTWTKHLKDSDEKTNFEQYIKGSKRLLSRLDQILKEEEDNLDTKDISKEMFTVPNWEVHQAYDLGFKSCIRKLRKLITLDQKEKE